MLKHLVKWSYILGMLCALAAMIWRAMNSMGWWMVESIVYGRSLYYMSMYKAALLFLLMSIASASYAAWAKQNP